MSLLRGRIYNRSKKSHGAEVGGRGNQYAEVNGQNVHLAESKATHETLGDRFGVSGKTVQRDGKFVSDIESLEEYAPALARARVDAGFGGQMYHVDTFNRPRPSG